ncbi:DUF4262 domain-containing protein [Micromonospora andamanensis]|uniref:DUF4262 domain-containing protein n=1 Tax=Micromonospora andamanensis TaxID=1287068 RepID=A0ABQ4HRZ5_9ACTN|nr:DUF4262 domain-containing protein [Micromonospora andamanensis]GIJ08417.1 hypothetical protein Van01_16310 [Micromonospora andamanensis]
MPPLEEFLQNQQRLINEFGWAVTAVLPDLGESGFAYTVGLTEHDVPELVIAGLDPLIAQKLLNDMAGRVDSRNERFIHGQRVADLLAGYDAIIVEGPATDALLPRAAYARYGKDRLRLQQIVWPDPHSRFPWDDRYQYPAHVQPLLGRP